MTFDRLPASIRRVDIIQEYVPAYRAPLFRAMREIAQEHGITIRILAGAPQAKQSLRNDKAGPGDGEDIFLPQREISVLGKRVNWRRTLRLTRSSSLIIVEQARRNIDVYGLLLRVRPPVAMWGHGRDFTNAAGRLSVKLIRWLTSRSTWFFGYTNESTDFVVTQGFPRERTTTLWNTTDTASLRANLSSVSDAERMDFRERVGRGGPLAVFIGGLDNSKRLSFLLAAADIVATRVPGFSLAILGSGADAALVSEAQAGREWLYLDLPVFDRALAIALHAADAIAMPGRVGLIAVDAIVAGVPVVTTDWPFHAPERAYLDDSNSLTTSDSVESYAEGLAAALTDPHLRDKLRAGCAIAAPMFSIEAMAERFVQGIMSALDGPEEDRRSWSR